MPNYPGISSEAFRHPLDLQAEQTLRSVPGFDLIARKFVEFIYERPQQIYLLGNSIQVGPRQYATIYGIFRECLRDLDIYPEPALFISQTPWANAYSLGQDRPQVILSAGILDLLTEAEIRTVIAHELGHIKCGHTTLIQMGLWAISAVTFIGELTLGLGVLFSRGVILAFYEWRRRAELSADRAALLVTDDLKLVLQTMMKLAGGSSKYIRECNLDEFIQQSDQYQELDTDALNQVYKFLLYNGDLNSPITHPFAVERVRYLQEWAVSEEYRQIRQGNYRRAGAEGAVNVAAESPNPEAEALRRELEELQREIQRIKSRPREE
jgi:Zn-dependent protease with chaperone function